MYLWELLLHGSDEEREVVRPAVDKAVRVLRRLEQHALVVFQVPQGVLQSIVRIVSVPMFVHLPPMYNLRIV